MDSEAVVRSLKGGVIGSERLEVGACDEEAIGVEFGGMQLF